VIYSRNSSARERSVTRQDADGVRACGQHGWPIVAQLSDLVSASRYGHKARDGWTELLDLVEGDRLDHGGVIVLWEASRGSRQVGEWVNLVDQCRQRHIKMYETQGDGRLYDPAGSSDDYHTLCAKGVDSSAGREIVWRPEILRPAGLREGAAPVGQR
jgi:site-specific DNA recombinase